MKRLFSFIFLLVIFAPSCVEHFISVNVQPDGSYILEFISRGDSTDLFDDDFPHTTEGKHWAQHIWKELKTIQPGSWKPEDI